MRNVEFPRFDDSMGARMETSSLNSGRRRSRADSFCRSLCPRDVRALERNFSREIIVF